MRYHDVVAVGEPVVAFQYGRAGVVEATHLRSTAICSAVLALRQHGLFDRYLDVLEPRYRDEIPALPAGEWIPVDMGLAHYSACDRLNLDDDAVRALGADVSRRILKNLLSVVVKLSRGAGVGPWTALPHANRLREAMWQGSEIAVWKLGPKEARLEWAGQPCARTSYFRTSFGSLAAALLQVFCEKVYVRPLPQTIPTSMQYRISWV
jgi:hypothetical protein